MRLILREKNNSLEEAVTIPNKLFHGSPYEFSNFDASKSVYRGLTFFSNNTEVPKAFAGGKGKDTGFLYTVSFNGVNIFDSAEIKNLVLLKPVVQALIQKKYKDTVTGMNYSLNNLKSDKEKILYVLGQLKKRSWKILENEDVLNIIKQNKFDGILTSEGGDLNFGLFPEALKKVKILNKQVIDVFAEDKQYEI